MHGRSEAIRAPIDGTGVFWNLYDPTCETIGMAISRCPKRNAPAQLPPQPDNRNVDSRIKSKKREVLPLLSNGVTLKVNPIVDC